MRLYSSSKSRAFPHTISLLLLTTCTTMVSFCDGNAGEPPASEVSLIDSLSCSSASASRTVSSGTQSSFFDCFLAAYEETVDTIVGLQMTTWNYIPRYKSFDESKIDGMCNDNFNAHLYSNIPKFERSYAKDVGANNGTKIMDEIEYGSESFGTRDLHNDFQHDRESDIDGYLTQLAEECSRDINDDAGATRYTTGCLNLLKNIVYEPRCTTRYDSRVDCNGKPLPPTNYLSPPRELIMDHFGSADDSLNVVVLGAGPIGLMLGNALAMLKRRQQQQQGSLPPIRILILETRADAPGAKKPYIRNWQAHLNLLHFRNTADPRLLKIFASMTPSKDYPGSSTETFVFPLNVIETLLLLSNRDLGDVKFLFGINPLELVDDLRDVPNLVLVDATGHRLEPLRRGPVCDGLVNKNDNDIGVCQEEDTIIKNFRTPPPPVVPWLNSKNSDFYETLSTFKLDFTNLHSFAEDHGQHIHIGRSEDVLYPIDEETELAKSIYWLDIHGAMPLTSRQLAQEGEQQVDNLYASDGELCDWCKEWFEKEDINNPSYTPKDEHTKTTNMRCNHMCYTSYYSQSTHLMRNDINEQIHHGRFIDAFVYHSDSWFPIMGYSFNPAHKLATKIKGVLSNHGFLSDPSGMPLRDFYPALKRSINVRELSIPDLELMLALKRYSLQSNTTKWPTVTLYVQQPFIYTSGFKKKKKCGGNSFTSIGDHLEDTPMIRIGNSFTVGDGINGAGLHTHATMVGVFMDAILEKISPSSSL